MKLPPKSCHRPSSSLPCFVFSDFVFAKFGVSFCNTGNPIDDCWRCNPDWHTNRQRLADCTIGFGMNTIGSKNGRIYMVTDSSDNHNMNPKPGTLHHAVIQDDIQAGNSPIVIAVSADRRRLFRHHRQMVSSSPSSYEEEKRKNR
ncbi:hypothetical protein V2J09_003284 [Rumex salicifolius]